VFLCLQRWGFEKYLVLRDEDVIDPKEAHGLSRYKQLWKHDCSNKYFVASDSSGFVCLAEKTDSGLFSKINKFAYGLEAFRDLWFSFTKYTVNLNGLDTESAYRLNIARYIDEYRSKKSLFFPPMLGLEEYMLDKIFYFYDSRNLIKLYNSQIDTAEGPELDSLIDELSNLKHFLSAMTNTSRLLMPISIGPQCGDFPASQYLATKIAEIAFGKTV
jgi:hypothetical protein